MLGHDSLEMLCATMCHCLFWSCFFPFIFICQPLVRHRCCEKFILEMLGVFSARAKIIIFFCFNGRNNLTWESRRKVGVGVADKWKLHFPLHVITFIENGNVMAKWRNLRRCGMLFFACYEYEVIRRRKLMVSSVQIARATICKFHEKGFGRSQIFLVGMIKKLSHKMEMGAHLDRPLKLFEILFIILHHVWSDFRNESKNGNFGQITAAFHLFGATCNIQFAHFNTDHLNRITSANYAGKYCHICVNSKVQNNRIAWLVYSRGQGWGRQSILKTHKRSFSMELMFKVLSDYGICSEIDTHTLYNIHFCASELKVHDLWIKNIMNSYAHRELHNKMNFKV